MVLYIRPSIRDLVISSVLAGWLATRWPRRSIPWHVSSNSRNQLKVQWQLKSVYLHSESIRSLCWEGDGCMLANETRLPIVDHVLILKLDTAWGRGENQMR